MSKLQIIRLCGSFEAAEETMQEAFAAALVDWPVHGVPHSPPAWITTTAHRKLIDALRRERTRRTQQAAVSYEPELAVDESTQESEVHLDPDDRLRLIFTSVAL